MIGQTISHYRIIEKLGEVPIRLDLANEVQLNPFFGLSERLWRHIPLSSGGSGNRR